MSHRAQSFIVLCCVLACTLIPGCQGSGDNPATRLAAPVQPVVAEPTDLPAFPFDDIADGAPRMVSVQDNIELGSEYYGRSLTGTQVNGTALELDSSSTDPCWAVWRWGTFNPGIVPLEVTIDVDPGADEYWLLVSDYHLQHWRVYGPLTDTTLTHTYSVGINHVSPTSGYTYVTLLTTRGNALTVNQLNMIANDDVVPPAAPQNLAVSAVEGFRVELQWTGNSESDLDGYNIYSGPETDFDINDPGVVHEGHASAASSSAWVDDLSADTEYHFRITAVDNVYNESSLSNTATTTTLNPTSYPTNLHVVDISGGWVDLAWDEPEAGPPFGYEVYTGPELDFEVDDPGVVKRNESLVPTTEWRVTGLAGETDYIARVRAYYASGPSPLSDAVEFTTENNSAPIPSFTVSPQYVQCNEQVIFNPAGTSDEDTPEEELLFQWDFNNDDVVDHETTGPEIATYTYHQRGPMTAKLTVSDGTPVSTTRDFTINYGYDYIMRNPSTGAPAEVIAMDTDPAGTRIAVLTKVAASTVVEYYDGTSWSEVSADGVEALYFSDIALSPDGFSVLVTQADETTSYWTTYNYNGTSWIETAKTAVSDEAFISHRLDIAANGRLSVIAMEAYFTGSQPVVSHYVLYVWHEKADSTFAASNVTLENDNWEAFDVQRNNDNSYFIYALSGNLHVWEFNDTGNSNTVPQTYSGDIDELNSGYDPDDDTHIFWAGATDGNAIYWGDNYGTANGAQSHAVSFLPTNLLGAGLAGDNEAVFYWTDEDANAVQRLLEYDSVSGGGTETVLGSGAGFAGGGAGGYLVDGASAGVYTCADEKRDGIICGRFMVGGSVDRIENVYLPAGNNANILGNHQPLVFSDDTILCLSEQSYGTARGSAAASTSGAFSDLFVGDETWCIPNAACITGTADEYFVGSYREMFTTPVLELNRFTKGNSVGTLEDSFTGTTQAKLVHHPDAGGTMLCYAASNDTAIEVRTWDGAAWSAATGIYSGSALIENLTLTGHGTNEWAVGFVDDDENVKLVETSGGTWSSAETLLTGDINGPSGIGLGYHADGSAAVVIEYNGATPGVNLGMRPGGGSFTWSEISPSTGNEVRYLHIAYHLENPLVLFYLRKVPSRNSRIQIVEYFDDAWTTTELPVQIHGAPVNYAMDSSNNIIIAGYNMSAEPRYASIGILYN